MRGRQTDPAAVPTSATQVRSARLAPGRRPGWAGVAFVILVLFSAGVASVPGGKDPTRVIEDFYSGGTTIIVVAQVLGLLAAAGFALFTWALSAHPEASWARPVRLTGYAVAAAAALTAVPVLWLCIVVRTAPASTVHRLATLSDLSDVLLFGSVGLFATSVADAADARWLRLLSGAAAGVGGARALFLLLGSPLLGLLAPLSFITLVLALSIACLSRPRGSFLRS
jgi:hypothetical protein